MGLLRFLASCESQLRQLGSKILTRGAEVDRSLPSRSLPSPAMVSSLPSPPSPPSPLTAVLTLLVPPVLDSTSGKPAPDMRIRLDRLNTSGFVLLASGSVFSPLSPRSY
jgi:hypothetical protein